jgi:hypothetical protein
MKQLALKIFSVVFVILFPILLFAEETFTITTYYPAPYGVYREMRARRMAVGDNYVDHAQYCWGGGCLNAVDADADLIVEGNVGIGTVNSGDTILN